MHSQDCTLGHIDDWCAEEAAEYAAIRNRKRSTRHVLNRQFSITRLAHVNFTQKSQTFVPRAEISFSTSKNERNSAFRNTGVTSPLGVETATLMSQ